MFYLHTGDDELRNWNEVTTLSSEEDVATLLMAYNKCLEAFKPEDIAGIVERDGYYACVINTGVVNEFDLFSWVNSLYCNRTEVNCANARFLFPEGKSRGEYEKVKEQFPTGNTGDLGDDNDDVATGFWDEGDDDKEPQVHCVIHISVNAEIPIEDEDGVTFGRSSTRVGYSVDNDLMSRLHARVYLEEGKYMVEDLGSKNGTFINNVKVFPGRDREIKPGNTLRMANEEFKFA